jgi:hypothetical protein
VNNAPVSAQHSAWLGHFDDCAPTAFLFMIIGKRSSVVLE